MATLKCKRRSWTIYVDAIVEVQAKKIGIYSFYSDISFEYNIYPKRRGRYILVLVYSPNGGALPK